MRKRNYNKKTYKAFAKTTKKIRNHCSDDPLEEIKKTGLTGEVLGGIIDKPIDAITHKASNPVSAKKSERVDNYTSNFYCLQKFAQQGGQCHFSS